MFVCLQNDSEACLGDKHYWCEPDGEFLLAASEDCSEDGKVCVGGLWCVVCDPGAPGCDGPNAVVCNDEGTGWDIVEECLIEEGFACRDGACQNLCAVAQSEQSYQGCEFYAVDLDNAAIEVGRDAASQPFAVVVSNPGVAPTVVSVELNRAPFGEDPEAEVIEEVTVLPGDLEVIELPRREVDGSSSNATCSTSNRECEGRETCVCSSHDTAPPCFCRLSEDTDGLNDGTHTALSSQAYHIESVLPIIAYQFNPLENVGVFSNDASLLLPTSAIGREYSVVGWPQTIANDSVNPDLDFDPRIEDEDLRAFLTIVGTKTDTQVSITLGVLARRVEGFEGFFEAQGPGGQIDLTVGPFDVINLETTGLNADFTGTIVSASEPITVFVGSEASDAPRFSDYSTRLCCADHLEEQLFPNTSLGSEFIIARMPRRTTSLNEAFIDPVINSVPEVNEPEWVRVVAVGQGETTVSTTLPYPDDRFIIREHDSVILTASQDFLMNADQPVAVLQILPSQEAVGLTEDYPGGDPAIVAIPPIEQYRKDYVFLTPDKYAFDYITITADAETEVLLDGVALDPSVCTTSPADGLERMPDDPPPEKVIYRCQFSFPQIDGYPPNLMILDGDQNDGVHTVLADDPVGIVIYGFDAYVSYAYAGGLNLEVLN